jgi:dihydroorotase
MDTELLIKNGRVIDPANNIDKVCDVLVSDGQIAQVGKVEKNVQNVINAGQAGDTGSY